MTASRFITTLVVAIAFLFARTADAKVSHKHHDGHKALGDKLKKDGTHQLHTHGEHTTHVDVKGGKITGFHAKHSKKGELPTKKHKSDKKLASIDSSDPTVPADTMLGTTTCGYSFVDVVTGDEIYTWFPCAIIADDFTGAITYVPIT
jgi:hypothetical protein